MALCWGASPSAVPFGSLPGIAPASAVLLFRLEENHGNAAGVMTLLRPGALREGECFGQGRSFYVAITMADRTWSELIADDRAPGASQLRIFADDPAADAIVLPLTPVARLAVESIRRCPFGGACRDMALSARCHDLLLEFLTTLSGASANRLATSTQGLDRQVRAAAQLLTEDLETPPTVAELARRVGLGETTLKRGFHQVFGTTIFGYLRTRRMERAREALQSGKATVLEAAAMVGYSNPSNFAAAFRRQFGVTPKKYQLAVRR